MTKEELEKIFDDLIKYIDKMSYCPVIDNPKKDLIKILRKVKNE